MAALDGVRGIAIALVVIAHAFDAHYEWLQGCVLGVDVFFVLSGFLITTLLLEELAAAGTLNYRDFYARRCRRLLPALATLLAVGAAVGTLIGARLIWETAMTAVRVSYLSNVLLASGVSIGGHFTHLWSLAQEEQFYLAWPVVLSLMLSRRMPRWAIITMLATTVAAVCIHREMLGVNGASYDRLFFAPDTRIDALLVGCIAAVARPRVRPAVVVAGCTMLALAIATFRGSDTADFGWLLLLASVGSAIIIVAAVNEGRTARVLSNRPLQMLGRCSYSLYLWHFPLVVMFGAIGVVPAMATAALSYRYVERPFRRSRERRWLAATQP